MLSELNEIALQGLNPYLPDNPKGPEMDMVPVLIPVPEAFGQKSWLLFPAGQDSSGHNIVSINYNGLYSGGWAFGISTQLGKASHYIRASDQFYAVSRLLFYLPGAGLPFMNFQAFPLSDGTSRLAIITQGTSYNPLAPWMYITEFPRYVFSDAGTALDLGGTMGPGEIQMPHVDFNNNLYVDRISSQPFTTALPIGIVGIAPLPDRSGSFIIQALSPSPSPASYSISGYSFLPAPTPIDSIVSTVIPAPAVSSGKSLPSYTTYSANKSQFTLSSLLSYAGPYSLTSLTSPIPTLFETPTSIPIVRTLTDGTLLALVNRHWAKATIDPSTGTMSVGAQINTGTMVFIYDYIDSSSTKWLVFSQALVVPNLDDTLKADNLLVMRNWQIKQSDLIP